jgi:hypothetical protein
MRGIVCVFAFVVFGLLSSAGCGPASEGSKLKPPTPEEQKKIDEVMKKAAEKNK